MKKSKLTAVISLVLLAAMALSLAACTNQNQQYSDENAYVSVYVYDSDGKKKLSVDKLRVAPDPENEAVYRRTPTGLYALELACADKTIDAPEIFGTGKEGEKEYTLLSVSGVQAETKNSGDVYYWKFSIGDGKADSEPVAADYATTTLHTYDILEFTLVEQTNRAFPTSFSATNGAVKVYESQEFNLTGEKYELTLADYLTGKYTEEDKTIDVAKALNITLAENKKTIESISGIKADETHEWVVLINGEVVPGNLNDLLVYELSESNLLEITFDYQEIVVEDTTEPAGTDVSESTAEQ